MTPTELQIRLRLMGGAEANNQLRQTNNVINQITQNSAQNFNNAASAAQSLLTPIAQIGASALVFSVLQAGIQAAVSTISALPRAAMDFNAEMEVSKNGLAGILTSMTAINGSSTSFTQSLNVSGKMMAALSDDALRTAASSKELVNTFQAILGPGLAAGMTLDQIRQITVVGANAVKSMGLNSAQLVQEMRDLVQGGITSAGSTLATALGLRDSDIAKAKASSEGLFSFLIKRTAGFAEASNAAGNTMRGSIDQLQESATRVVASGIEPINKGLAEAAQEASKLFFSMQGDKPVLNQDAISSIRETAKTLVDFGRAGGQSVKYLYEHRDAILAIGVVAKAVAFGQIAASIAAMVVARVEAGNLAVLAAAQNAAEAASNQTVVLTTRQKTAAYLEQLAVAKAQAIATRELIVMQIAQTEAQIAATAGMARLTLVQSTLIPLRAQHAAATAAATMAELRHAEAVAATSVVSRTAAGVLGFLGGPIGAIVTALTLGAAAWMMWGDKAEDAGKRAKTAIESAKSVYERLDQEKTFGAGDAGSLKAGLAALNERKRVLDAEQQKFMRESAAVSRDAFAAENSTIEIPDYKEIARVNSEIAKVSGALADLEKSNKAAVYSGQVATESVKLNNAQLVQQWMKVTAELKTAAGVQEQYKRDVEQTNRSYSDMMASLKQTGASDAEISKRMAEKAAADKALKIKLNADLKALRQAEDGEALSTYNRNIDIAIKAIARHEAAQIAAIKARADNTSAAEVAAIEQIEKVKIAAANASIEKLRQQMARNYEPTEKASIAGKIADEADKIRAANQEAINSYAKLSQAAAEARRVVLDDAASTSFKLVQETKAMRDALAAIGLNGYALATLQSDRLQAKQVIEETTAATLEQAVATMQLSDALLAGDVAVSEAITHYKRLAEEKRAAAKEFAEQAGLTMDAAYKEANVKAAQDAKEAWETTRKSIGDGLYDAITGSGKSAADWLKNWFKRLVLNPIIEPFANLGASILNPQAAQSEQTNLGLISSVKKAYDAINNGFSGLGNSISEGIQSGLNFLKGSGGYPSQGPMQIGSTAQAFGQAGQIAAAIYAGKTLGTMISGGYQIGNHGSALVNLGTLLGGPIGGAIAGGLNRMFGMQDKVVQSAGVRGTISSAGFAGDNYQNWTQKGGWFRSDKAGTNLSPVDSAVSNTIVDAYSSIKNASAEFAKTLGINADFLAARSQALDIVLTQDAASNQKAITEFFSGVGDNIAKELLPQIGTFSKVNESASATLGRLSQNYLAVDAVLDMLGKNSVQVFGAVGVASISAREKIVDFAGGFDSLVKGTAFFSEKMLDQKERMTPIIASVSKQLETLGVGNITTKQQYKQEVLKQDLNTDAGAKQYANLLALSPKFLQVFEYQEEVRKDLLTRKWNLWEKIGRGYDAALEKQAEDLKDLTPQQAEIQAQIFAAEEQRKTQQLKWAYWESSGRAYEAALEKQADELRNLSPDQSSYQAQIHAALAEKKSQELKWKFWELTGKSYEAALARQASELNGLSPNQASTQQKINNILNSQSAASSALAVLNKSIDAKKTQLKSQLDAQIAVLSAQKSAAQAEIEKRKSALSANLQYRTDANQNLSNLVANLKSSLDGFKVAGRQAINRTAAQEAIARATSLAKVGVLPQADALADAIKTLSEPAQDLYSSAEDYARDVGVTAGQLADLNSIAQTQLSAGEEAQKLMQAQLDAFQIEANASTARFDAQQEAAQKAFDAQVSAFETQAKSAQDQLDALNGTRIAVLDVARAMQEFNQRLLSLSAAGQVVVDGSHRDGLGYVPFDGYLAELHEGEAVLTAAQRKDLINFKGNTTLLANSGGEWAQQQILFELQMLRTDVQEGQAAIAANTEKTARRLEILEYWQQNGAPQ